MAHYKRIHSDYSIIAVDSGSTITLQAEDIVINGDLRVSGTTTSVETTNTSINDNIIILNEGETDVDGVGGGTGTSGLEVDRGTHPNGNSLLIFDETDDKLKFSIDGGSSFVNILTSTGSGTGLENVVEDTTPQLGGNLDVQSFGLTTSTTNGDITLTPNGSGTVKIESAELALDRLASDPTAQADYNLLYHKTEGSGGTGLYFKTTTTADELVSKSKAIVYGIIF
jgi:hypothetical protein